MFDTHLGRFSENQIARLLLVGTASWVGTSFAAIAAAQDTPAESAPAAEPAPPDPPSPAAPPPPAEPPKKELPPAKITLEETPDEKITLEETPEPPPAQRRAPPKRPAKKPQGARPRATPRPPERARRSAPEPAPEKAPPLESEPSEKPAADDASGDPPKSEEPESKSKKDDDDGDGLLGPFRIGPLLGVGLPSVVSFGGMIKITRYLGAGVNIGLIPAIRVSFYGEAELSYQEYDLYGRIFPFGGALFAGAGVGYATMSGRFRASYDVSAYQSQAPGLPNPLFIESEGSVRTLVLTPTIGLLHTFGSGFTIGVDVGAQIPIAPSETSFETTLPPSVPPQVIEQYVKPADKKVQDTLDTVGRTILPTLNFRIGWML